MMMEYGGAQRAPGLHVGQDLAFAAHVCARAAGRHVRSRRRQLPPEARRGQAAGRQKALAFGWLCPRGGRARPTPQAERL